MEDQLENMASFASIRIEDAITLCQRPSYEKTWENAWKKYLRGDYSRNDYLQDVYTSLRGKFYLDERFNMYAYYCYGTEDPESFSSRTGISLKSYVDEIQPYLKDVIDSDSAYGLRAGGRRAYFYRPQSVHDDGLYTVRHAGGGVKPQQGVSGCGYRSFE